MESQCGLNQMSGRLMRSQTWRFSDWSVRLDVSDWQQRQICFTSCSSNFSACSDGLTPHPVGCLWCFQLWAVLREVSVSTGAGAPLPPPLPQHVCEEERQQPPVVRRTYWRTFLLRGSVRDAAGWTPTNQRSWGPEGPWSAHDEARPGLKVDIMNSRRIPGQSGDLYVRPVLATC